PAADAVADDDAVDVVVALSVTALVALMSRNVVAVAVCDTNVSAIAAPSAAEPLDVVSPAAVVVAFAVVLAVNVAVPVGDRPAPNPACASLATLLMASATAGAIETPPPDAPVLASVVIVFVVVALSEKSCEFASVAPLPR